MKEVICKKHNVWRFTYGKTYSVIKEIDENGDMIVKNDLDANHYLSPGYLKKYFITNLPEDISLNEELQYALKEHAEKARNNRLKLLEEESKYLKIALAVSYVIIFLLIYAIYKQ